jgi:hypothetical protein
MSVVLVAKRGLIAALGNICRPLQMSLPVDSPSRHTKKVRKRCELRKRREARDEPELAGVEDQRSK